jgi:hypothetical protein
MAAVAMVDRLIHDAELISHKGDSYRLKDRDLGPRPTRPGGHHLTDALAGISLRSPTARSAKRRRHNPQLAYFSTGANP